MCVAVCIAVCIAVCVAVAIEHEMLVRGFMWYRLVCASACVCWYACVYGWVCVDLYTQFVFKRVRELMCACVHACMCGLRGKHPSLNTYIYMFTYIYIDMYVYTCTYIYLHIYIHI